MAQAARILYFFCAQNHPEVKLGAHQQSVFDTVFRNNFRRRLGTDLQFVFPAFLRAPCHLQSQSGSERANVTRDRDSTLSLARRSYRS